jgi:hypothetical protein
MTHSSTLRDACRPSSTVTMTTRLLAPVGAFALGAYAENRGYVDAALRKARDVDPNVSAGVDALFAAVRDGERAVTSAVEGAGAENAIEAAMRTMRETLATMTAPLFATSGREAEATLGGGAGRSVEEGVIGEKVTSVVRGVRVPTLGVREMFIAGALTGMVVAYAYGPERCAAAARRVYARCVEAVNDARAYVEAKMDEFLSLEFREAIEETIDGLKEALQGAQKQLEPLLKSSSDNLFALAAKSKETTTAYAGKVTAFVGDLNEKYLNEAVTIVRARAIEGFQSAKSAAKSVAPALDAARRHAREFLAAIRDGLVAPKSDKSQ